MPETKHWRTCNLCEAMCGLEVTVADGRITSIRGDASDPFSRGHVCPKGPALRDLYEDPDRLRRPVRRTRGGWQQVSWDEALRETAERIEASRTAHGRNAVGVYVGNPAVHNHGAMLALQGLLGALRTRNRFDANSQDANPKILAATLMYGDSFALTVPDVDRTRHLLMLGANPAMSNGSLFTMGDPKGRLRGVRERGGTLVLVDPRRNETTAWADAHHFVRPGGDAALLLAMLHVLFAEDRVDARAVARDARNVEALKRICRGFSPARVAGAIGLHADTITAMARTFAETRPAVAYGRIGVCLGGFGTLASCLIEALNVVTGNFDVPGGSMFASPAVDLGSLGRKLVGSKYARWRSRVRGLPELGGQLPAAVMSEEIETPGEGQIRAMLVIAGNPVLSTPNGPRLAGALATLDFMACVDPFVNETSRHAHVILPPVHPFERTHYDLVFHGLAVRNTAKFGDTILPPPADTRTDWDILMDLAMRLGGARFGIPGVDPLLRLAWKAGVRPDPDLLIDGLLRTGPYGAGFRPGARGLSLSTLRENPHGVDLGALVPSRHERVRTADGKVDVWPSCLEDEIPRLERWLEEAAREGSLVLIGRRHVRSNNSWLHNCPSLVKGPDRSQLLVHPQDAARLGITDGAAVRIESRVGQVQTTAQLTDEVMPGVVSLPHGYGHAEAADTLHVAGALAGPNANALTDELRLDPVSGTASLNGVPVTVTPC